MNERQRSLAKIQLPMLIQTISKTPDFQASLTITLEQICESANWDYGEAWIPSFDGRVLELSPAWYRNHHGDITYLLALTQFRYSSEGLVFPPATGLPGRVWSSRQPEWIAGATAQSETSLLRHQMAKVFGIRTGLGVPIIVNEQVLAVLVFFMLKNREEDSRMSEFIQQAATSCFEGSNLHLAEVSANNPQTRRLELQTPSFSLVG